jgi:hypothetical protein
VTLHDKQRKEIIVATSPIQLAAGNEQVNNQHFTVQQEQIMENNFSVELVI